MPVGGRPYVGRIKKIDPGSRGGWAMCEAADAAMQPRHGSEKPRDALRRLRLGG